MRTLAQAGLAGVITVVLAAGGASSASAASVSAGPSPAGYELGRYVAAPGEVNDVIVSQVDLYTVRIVDSGALIAAGQDCRSIDAHTAECSSPVEPFRRYFTGVAVQAGDGNDRVESVGKLTAGLRPGDGGPGDDTLIGSLDTGDILDGGGGHDTLRGRGNSDTLIDGDTSGSADADVLDGGGGNDTVSYRNRTRRLFVDLGNPRTDGQRGEHDKLIAINSVEGGSADDRLSGSGGSNKLEGMGGDDRIEGRGGDDELRGGSGHDTVLGRLGNDWLVGGTYHDRLFGAQGNDRMDSKSGGDDLDCGRAFDTARAPRPADFLGPSCDRVAYHGFTASAYPVKHHRASVDFHLDCPRRRLPDIRGSMRIRESGGRRRTLGKRSIHHSGRRCRREPSPQLTQLTVRVHLTSLGRRKASRRKGIRATVELRGRSFRNVDWTIELHNG